MAFGQYDGSIRINTSLNTNDFNAALGKITNAVKKLGAAVGVSLGITALVKFGKEAIDIASDVQEVQNVVDTAFGSMSGMVDEFASTAIEKLGMSELAAKQIWQCLRVWGCTAKKPHRWQLTRRRARAI